MSCIFTSRKECMDEHEAIANIFTIYAIVDEEAIITNTTIENNNVVFDGKALISSYPNIFDSNVWAELSEIGQETYIGNLEFAFNVMKANIVNVIYKKWFSLWGQVNVVPKVELEILSNSLGRHMSFTDINYLAANDVINCHEIFTEWDPMLVPPQMLDDVMVCNVPCDIINKNIAINNIDVPVHDILVGHKAYHQLLSRISKYCLTNQKVKEGDLLTLFNDSYKVSYNYLNDSLYFSKV